MKSFIVALVAIAVIVGILFGTGIIGGKKKDKPGSKAGGDDVMGPMSDMQVLDDTMTPPVKQANYQPIKDAIAKKAFG